MKNYTIYLSLFLSLLFMGCQPIEEKSYNQGINVIPQPLSLEQKEGKFIIESNTKLGIEDPSWQQIAEELNIKIKNVTGYNLKINQEISSSGNINLLKDTTLGKEAYEISSNTNRIILKASTDTGMFYAMQTLLQLLPAEIESKTCVKNIAFAIPAVEIKDSPRFGYRGVMIDVCRHFFDVEQIKKHLDIMGMLKLNKLHLHLTENQSWRIEIKKYPQLVANGAIGEQYNGEKYGPYFFTQDDIREIVSYAASKHIEVIPEIEFPGHTLSALVSFPELSCTGGPFKSELLFGYETNVFCVGNEEVFHFMEDILKEVSELFPSKYIHIGGDECSKIHWEKCPKCQQRAKELHLKKTANHSVEEQLQSYSIQRIEKFVRDSLKKQIIGWDEILEGGLAPEATVMSWRGEEGGLEAANSNHNVIMAPMPLGLYLCNAQGASEVEPAASGLFSYLHEIYSYNPIPNSLSEEKHKYVLGAEACLWSEWVLSDAHLDYMLYPRVIALAEINWTTPSNKNWDDFLRRLNNMQVRLDMLGINYHIPLPEGVLTNNIAFTDDSVTLRFTNSRNLPMVYTLNGEKPNKKSPLFSDSLTIHETCHLQIATLLNSGKTSKVRSLLIEKQKPQKGEDITYDPSIRMQIADGYFGNEKEYFKADFHTDTTIQSFTDYPREKLDFRQPSLLLYSGFIDLPETGIYTFYSNSDELWIDNERVIYNPTLSRFYRQKHQKALSKGIHSFKMTFTNRLKDGFATSWKPIDFKYILPSGKEVTKK